MTRTGVGENRWQEIPEHVSTTEGILDFNWWASDGPTGGYLISLAIEAASRAGQLPYTLGLSLDLRIVGGASADGYEAALVTVKTGSGSDTAIVFQQNTMPFAIASLRGTPSEQEAIMTSSVPAGALPPQAYDEMAWQQPSPPVTSQFSYRPVVSSDGTSLFSDWDLVWIRPMSFDALRYGATGVVDSWYPANFMRAVREFLQGETSFLHEPSATELLTLRATIADPKQSLAPDEHVLLASRLTSARSGQYDEYFEIWSESGSVLVAGRIIRRDSRSRSSPQMEQPRLHR